MTHFNQFADALDISFECPHCYKRITYHTDEVISPDWSGDTVASSTNYDDDYICCEHCGCNFAIDVYVNIRDGVIVVADEDTKQEIENVTVQEIFMTDEEFENSLL